jgi:CubicO group peptidase (beta-lactamase class C family)
MGASMQGGVGGHAGLFGTAEDVSKVMQLFLNKGNYANNKIFNSDSFDLFNKRHFSNNRRGIGFDKPQLDDNVLSTCGCVSDESFGHSGFTGTYAWADPKDNLIYVFLSNRTYPTMKNNKISENNIRTEVHRLIKEALE